MADTADLLGPANFIPTLSVAVDLSGGTDHSLATVANAKTTLAPFARRIFVGVAGDVVAQLLGDSTTRTWKAQAGQYLTGAFILVSASSTATNMIAEQ